MHLLIIDNYDSFTYNLFHYLGELGEDVRVVRNDQIGVDEALSSKPRSIVISPGPCDPDRAGICLDLIKKADGRVPLLGVCLGHQCIGQAYGGKILRAPTPMHGKLSHIHHTGKSVFEGLEDGFEATRRIRELENEVESSALASDASFDVDGTAIGFNAGASWVRPLTTQLKLVLGADVARYSFKDDDDDTDFDELIARFRTELRYSFGVSGTGSN